MEYLFFNLFLPIIVSFLYFLMAFYLNKVKPLRLLILGEKLYNYAFFVFFLFGIYLIGRPLQIFLGHPLLVSNIREFIMIGMISPCILIGMFSHISFDQEKHFSTSKYFIFGVFGFCFLLGLFFILFNNLSISGMREVFRAEILNINFLGLDGNWFYGNSIYLKFLFLIRMISPILIITFSGIYFLISSYSFPIDSVYNNISKKFFFLGISLILFIISLFITGFIAYFYNYQNQWYYLGGLISGILSLISLKMPPRNFKIKNDVK